MKSELVPGYEFEYTFDGVIFNEYDEFLHKKYKVNREYIHNHIEELIQLPDVYIAIPLTSVFHKEFIHKRFMDDLDVGDGKLGLYQWCNLFFKIHACPWEYTKEHYCRMLLDLVKKYPEHSEIIQLIENRIEKIIINQDYNQLTFMNFSEFIIDLKNKKAFYDLNNSITIYPEEDVDLDLRDVYNFHEKFEKLISNEVVVLTDDSIESFINDFVNLNMECELQKINDETLKKGLTFLEPCILNRCSVKIEYSDNVKEYSFVNHYPDNWIKFGKILENLVGFDVLNIENLKYLVTELHYDIKQDGVYSKETNKKLKLNRLTFTRALVGYGGGKISFNREENESMRFINLEDNVKEQILDALEKYGIYRWYHEDYLQNVIEDEVMGFDGHDWEIKLTFEDDITLNFVGHFNCPDTYLHFGKELFKLTGRDFFNVRRTELVMDWVFLKSLQTYGDMKLNYNSEVALNNSNNLKNELDNIYDIHWGDNKAYSISSEDFKTYLLPLMIYKEISEKIENHLNKELINDKLTFEEAYEHQEYQTPLKEEALEEVGYYLTPNYLFKNVMKEYGVDVILDLEHALNYLSDCETDLLIRKNYELLYDENYNLIKEFKKLKGFPFKYIRDLNIKGQKISIMCRYINDILDQVSIDEYLNFYPQFNPYL